MEGRRKELRRGGKEENMNTWEMYLFKDWNKVCKSVRAGLEKLGHDIPLVARDCEKETYPIKDETQNSST